MFLEEKGFMLNSVFGTGDHARSAMLATAESLAWLLRVEILLSRNPNIPAAFAMLSRCSHCNVKLSSFSDKDPQGRHNKHPFSGICKPVYQGAEYPLILFWVRVVFCKTQLASGASFLT